MRTLIRISALLSILWAAAAVLAQSPPSEASVAMTTRDSRTVTVTPGASPVLLAFTADPAAAGGDVFHVHVSRPGIAISLLVPSGIEVTAENAESQGFSYNAFEGNPRQASLTGPLAMPGFHTVIALPAGSTPGSYQIKAVPVELAEDAVVQVIYTSSSTVRAALTTGRPVYRAGDPVVFTGIFYDGSSPLSGVTADLRIRRQDDPAAAAVDLQLQDSSEVNEQAGDGQYFALWRPLEPGRYIAALQATGTSSSGVPFGRLASTSFRVLPPLARIESFRDSAVDEDGDGLADKIVLELNLDVKKAGPYQVLLNMRAGKAVVAGRARATLPEGVARIEVPFPLLQLNPLGVDGPFQLTDVFLLYLADPEPPVVDARADAGTTAPYPLSELLAAKTSPLTLSATALAFGDVQTGAGRELPLTLRNRSRFAFTEAVLRLAEGPFSILAPSAPFFIPAGSEMTLRVLFRPTAAGQRTATLSIAGVNIALTGNGLSPRVAVAPARLDFGRVAVNQTRDLTLAVRNTGDTPLAVSGTSLNNARFAVTAPATPFTIGVGQQQTVTVRFAPTAAGEQSGVLNIAGIDVPLTGTGEGGENPPPPPTPGQFAITSLDPASAIAGDFGFTLTVNGSGFVQGAAVRWNTQNRPTSYVSESQLTAAISRADIAAAGAASVTVANAGPSPAISGALSFTIAPASEPATSVLLQQFDRVDCPTLRVFASVLAPNGTPIERAPTARFACTENGSPVNCQTAVASDAGVPASIVLILSSNGLGSGLDAVRAAASAVISTMSTGDRAALVHLETQAREVQGFTSDRGALASAIAQIREVGEGHALLDAVNFATSLLASQQGRRQAVFLFTHRDNQGGFTTNAATVLSNARARGIPIYSLAFGPGLGSGTLGAFLKSMTADSHGILATEEVTSNLSTAAGRLSGIFRAQYAVTYNVPATAPSTFRLRFTDTSGSFFAERARQACGQ